MLKEKMLKGATLTTDILFFALLFLSIMFGCFAVCFMVLASISLIANLIYQKEWLLLVIFLGCLCGFIRYLVEEYEQCKLEKEIEKLKRKAEEIVIRRIDMKLEREGEIYSFERLEVDGIKSNFITVKNTNTTMYITYEGEHYIHCKKAVSDKSMVYYDFLKINEK